MADIEKGSSVDRPSEKSAKNDGDASSQIETLALSKRSLWIAILGLNLGMMLTALDFNIVAPALPKISTTFGRYDQAPWLGTGMLISFAISLPLYAHLGELLGHRNVFALSVLIFTLGSGLCAGAQSMEWLIWARVVQGAGSGGVYGSVNVIVTELVPLQEAGRYMSITQATWAIADVAGPLLGGAFAQYATWRWSFWINLFIAPMSLILVGWLLRLRISGSKVRRLHHDIDWVGAITLSGAAVCLLLAISWGGQTFAWKSKQIIGLFVGGVVLLAIFGYAASKTSKSILPLGILKNRTVIAILVAELFYGANLVSMIYFVPQFFVLAQKSTVILGGVKLIPMMIGLGIGSAVTGELVKRKGASRVAALTGVILMCIASGLIVRWRADTKLGESLPELFILGLGQGGAMTGLLMTAQVAVEGHEVGVVTGICIFAQAIGDVFGLAIFATLYNTARVSQTDMLRIRQGDVDAFLKDPVHSGLSGDLQRQLQSAVATSMTRGWWLMLSCALACLTALLFAKQHSFVK